MPPIDDYSQLYADAGQQYGVDPALLMAQGQAESSGDPDAVGPDTKYGNAKGLAQLIPSTAKSLGVTDPTDPKQAIPAQAKLMRENLDRYGDPETALMAYHGGTDHDNWGPKTKAYPGRVYQYYKQTQAPDSNPQTTDSNEKNLASGNLTPGVDDPFETARQEIQSKNKKVDPSEDSEDPFVSARKEVDEKNAKQKAQADSDAKEPGPEWLQNIGKATDTLGSNMSPAKMAGIVPSLAVAPVASALAEGSAAIPILGQAAKYVAGVAPQGSGLLANLGYRAAGGAAQGAAANTLMGGNPIEGAEVGGILNPALGIAGKIASPVVNALTGYGNNLSPELANLAKEGSEKYGVNIPGGLLSTNPVTKDVYSTLSRFGMLPDSDNIANFTKAASKTFGENTPKLTRTAMDNAEGRIGDMFDDVWDKTPKLHISDNVLNKLSGIQEDAEAIMPGDSRIPKQINKILDAAAANGGAIPSELAKNLVSTQSQLHKLTRLGTDPASDLAFDIKNTLYDSLGENAPPEVLNKYNQAKSLYKNYKTVEAAKPDPVTGELSPTSMANAVSKTAKKFGTNGLTDLQTLGDIGQQFSLTKSSGTAEKLLGAKLIGSAASGFRYNSDQGVHYDPVGALYGTGAIFGGNAAGKYLSSDMYRNHLIDSALANNASNPMLKLLTADPTVSNALITGNRITSQP